MTGDELAKAKEDGCTPILVDVRDPEKFATAHLPGARNIPVADLNSHLDGLRNAGRVLVY